MDEATLANGFGALSDPRRLRALRFIARRNRSDAGSDAAVCACHVADCLGLSQPATSYHMKVLREAGLVSADRRGRWVHYRISPDGWAALRRFVAKLDEAAGDSSEAAA